MNYRNKALVASMLFLCSVFAGNINYPSGARSAALSHSSVTLTDVWGTFNNQAGLAWVEKPTAAFYFENKYLLKEFSVKSGAFVVPLRVATTSFSVRHFGTPQFSESKMGIALSRKFTERFAAGMQFNYLQTHISEGYGNYSAVNAEVGLMVMPVDKLTVGFHLFNPLRFKKEALPEEKVPTVARLGIAYRMGIAQVFLETEKDIDFNPVYKCGVEVEATSDLFFRGGYASGFEQYSFGLGYKWRHLVADIAFYRHPVLGFSPNASLGFEF